MAGHRLGHRVRVLGVCNRTCEFRIAEVREKRLGAVFAVTSLIAGVWSAVNYQIVYYALIDSFPPQFQDSLNSRYAFPVYAMSPSTPLSLQADYLKSLAGGCFAMLCFSLSCFSFQRADGGCLALVGFSAAAVSAIKSWKTYKENCNLAADPRL